MFGINDCSKLPPPTLSLCCLIRNSLGYSYGNLDQISDVVTVVIILACSVARSINATSSLQLSLLYLKGYVTRVE